jgi:hypothetical protein
VTADASRAQTAGATVRARTTAAQRGEIGSGDTTCAAGARAVAAGVHVHVAVATLTSRRAVPTAATTRGAADVGFSCTGR